jgi:transcriptional antiterminator NusG
MFMPQRNDFIAIEPVRIGSKPDARQTLLIEKALKYKAIRIQEIASASRDVMVDSDNAAWICLSVRSGSELDVEKHLDKHRVNALVPCQGKEIVVRRGRRIEVPERPLLPGYVLVQCAVSAYAIKGLLSIPRVLAVVGGAERPMRIAVCNVLKFKAMCTPDQQKEGKPLPPYLPGEHVFIKAGPWLDFKGVIVQASKKSVVVELSTFGKSCEVTMPLAFVRKL